MRLMDIIRYRMPRISGCMKKSIKKVDRTTTKKIAVIKLPKSTCFSNNNPWIKL